MKTKEFVLSTVFILSILIIYALFPALDVFQQLIVMIIFLIIIPILFNKFILKKDFSAFALRIGDWKQGLFWGGISIVAGGLLLFLAIYFFGLFGGKYGVPKMITNNFGKFIYYEFILVLPVIFLYDFFFRGFLLSIFKEKMGYWAIVIQAALFLFLVIISGSLSWLMTVYLISAPLAGLILYKSNSLIYSTLFQFILITGLDAIYIYLIKYF
ncbi:MAG TPA: CPBP family intramembrane metalloprotease [Candidatus Moranbacteria bacterium]|nr:CPBP family intramembrane metalloprotease [Candidatus Moranbacteria bacterium]HRY27563.1 CPBP family intramembrane metalloprotease [Candidatus Moranbacteria bacterium]HSA07792.1 CPBP family intramembrane metalloprotease [Candidatus Moranbacteria bacterium]